MRWTARSTLILTTVVVALATAFSRPAWAWDLQPNPANSTPIPAGFSNYSPSKNMYVTDNPDPAVFIPQGTCPWLLPALTGEGFAKVDNTNPRGYSGANGWTINFAALQGGFTRDQYYPYADKAPAVSLGGMTVPATNQAGFGGSVFSLAYNPVGNDPTGGDAEWVQVVKTNFVFGANDPMKKFGYDAGGGVTYFIDNFYPGNAPAGNGTMNPTYDGGYNVVNNPDGSKTYNPKGFAGNNLAFIDVPSLPLTDGLFAQFQTFLAKDDLANQTLTIYDGVWWGFQVSTAPEPSTWICFLAGTGAIIFVRRRDLRVRRSRTLSAAA
jgi:hypothetical protein